MKKIISILLLITLTTACATSVKKLNLISLGDSKQDVFNALGVPNKTKASNNTTYLIYRLREPSSPAWQLVCFPAGLLSFGVVYFNQPRCTGGYVKEYFVRLTPDQKVEAFGNMGDFDSTKTSKDINLNIHNK